MGGRGRERERERELIPNIPSLSLIVTITRLGLRIFSGLKDGSSRNTSNCRDLSSSLSLMVCISIAFPGR